ncbi:WD40 repeat domain-containing protein [Flavobacterium sp. FlaQc-57]|uniref:WD40 repeat domain-containing protein n=1 Tax=Flavobacterium sp. FlaQc-57 TaxID=3374186 RepID=UPI0037568ABB
MKIKNKLLKCIILLTAFNNQLFAQHTINKKILWTTDWSSDGKFIAVGGNLDTLKIYSEKNLKSYKSFPIKNTITRIKWHPSKNIIAVATQLSEDKSSIINLDTNERIKLNGISPDGARGIDWNYTGEYLAVADNDGQILIYDIKGNLIRRFKNENSKGITAVDWHPKKNILVTVSDKIRLYDIEGNLLKSIKHRTEEVMLLSVAWHKSGSFFITDDYGDRQDKSLLQYWNEQAELLRSIDISKGEYRNITWNPKGNRLATASDALRIFDTKGKLISEGNSKDYLWGVSWNKQGDRIITSSMEQNIIIWNNKAEKISSIE